MFGSPRILILVAATVSVRAYVEYHETEAVPVDIFAVTEIVFGLNKTEFHEIAERGRMQGVYDRMRQEDLDGISWLRERGGDAYDFITEVISRAWFVDNDHFDRHRTSFGINVTYSRLSLEDQSRLMLPFPSFERIYFYALHPTIYISRSDHFGIRRDIVSDHEKLSLLEVRRLLGTMNNGFNSYFGRTKVLIEDLLYKDPMLWNPHNLGKLLSVFLKELRQFLEKYDYESRDSTAATDAGNIIHAIRILGHVIDFKGFTDGQVPLVKRFFDRLGYKCGPDLKCKLYTLAERIERNSK